MTPFEELGFTVDTTEHERKAPLAPRLTLYLVAEYSGVSRHKCSNCGAIRTCTVRTNCIPVTRYLLLGKVHDNAPPCRARRWQ